MPLKTQILGFLGYVPLDWSQLLEYSLFLLENTAVKASEDNVLDFQSCSLNTRFTSIPKLER